MNRGLARRTMFEGARDARYFFSWIARMVHAGLIEVHSYVVMTTHFHVLVRSPRGEIARAMMRIQGEYARWFNRLRRRDGPLHRGRYTSIPVRSSMYRRLIVRYIDANPVFAKQVQVPCDYPFGSARAYARSRGPIWLNREWTEAEVKHSTAKSEYDPVDYARVFGRSRPQQDRLIRQRIDHVYDDDDPLDDLVGAAPQRVREWMKRKAKLADGTRPGLPLVDPESLEEAVSARIPELAIWRLRTSRKSTPALPQIRAGLLRELCGSGFAEIGARLGIAPTHARTLHMRHQESMAGDEYSIIAAELGERALALCHGPGGEEANR